MFKKVILCLFCVLSVATFGFAQLNEGDVAISEFFEELFVYDAMTGSVTDVYDGDFGAPSPGQIAVHNGQIFGVDFDEFYRFDKGATSGTLIAKLPSTVDDLTIDQNGDFLFTSIGGGVNRIEAATGLVTEVFDDSFFSPGDVVVSGNGDIYVTEFFESLGRIRDGIFTPIGDFSPNEFAHVTIGQDGFLYTASTFGGVITRINPVTGDAVQVLQENFSIDELEVGVDGNLLLSASLDGVDGLFSIDPKTGFFTNLIDDPSFFSPSDIAVARGLNIAIPEPTSSLIVLGLGLAAMIRRKK